MNELEILKMECTSLLNEIQIQVEPNANTPRDIGILQRLINVNVGYDDLLAELNKSEIPKLIAQCQDLAKAIEKEKTRVQSLAKEVSGWFKFYIQQAEFDYFNSTADKDKINYLSWPLPLYRIQLNKYFKKYLNTQLEV